MRVSRLRIGMTLSTPHLLRSGLMDQALHILVAIHTGEHATVDGMLLLVFIHIQADRLSFELRGQSGIGVAGKTIFVLELVLGMCRTSPYKKTHEESLR